MIVMAGIYVYSGDFEPDRAAMPRSSLRLLLLVACAVAVLDGLLTRSAQASLFLCSSLAEPCSWVAHHQLLLAVLNFPASQLAVHFHHGPLASLPPNLWLVINALGWGLATFVLGWLALRVKRRAAH